MRELEQADEALVERVLHAICEALAEACVLSSELLLDVEAFGLSAASSASVELVDEDDEPDKPSVDNKESLEPEVSLDKPRALSTDDELPLCPSRPRMLYSELWLDAADPLPRLTTDELLPVPLPVSCASSALSNCEGVSELALALLELVLLELVLAAVEACELAVLPALSGLMLIV
jgi:hypothetical protein